MPAIPSLFVTATDTGVGKTVITAGLARILSDEGKVVGVMKPCETGWEGDPKALPSDARMLADAARTEASSTQICPYVYRDPVAPLVAARREDRAVDIGKIEIAYKELAQAHRPMLVEGAGGLSVPLTEGDDMADLAEFLNLPILIVTRPNLGTLNHTFLTVHYARTRGLSIAGIVISGFDKHTDSIAEQTNPAIIEEMCEVPVLAKVPRWSSIDTVEDAADAVRESGLVEALRSRRQ